LSCLRQEKASLSRSTQPASFPDKLIFVFKDKRLQTILRLAHALQTLFTRNGE